METRIDFSSDNLETTFAEGIFNCPSPLPLELNYPDFASITSDGSWEMSLSPPPTSLSPHLSLASSQDDLVPAHPATLIDNYARDRELATHNVRVNPQELKNTLTERGHGDKIEALDGLLGRIDEFITFRQIYGHDRDTRSRISPPETLGAPHFAPFLKKRHKSDGSHTRRTLFYVCMFCDHELSNRTQMVQHLMKHFRYFPHECHEWYVVR
jgi:hypothetical protein